MKRSLYFLAILIAMIVWPSSSGKAQVKDSVYVIEQLGLNPYECCYGFILQSRQPKGTKIDEFRVRIIEGDGKFLTGQSSSPFRCWRWPDYDRRRFMPAPPLLRLALPVMLTAAFLPHCRWIPPSTLG
ncbi:MAG: hypothetical protein UZ07_CHB004000760 [Chlorobi bacterium OLB7]|nr:MAG: hypothetical protein UZ07_CHB004000760 [Chlorobi bacterium OLB7]